MMKTQRLFASMILLLLLVAACQLGFVPSIALPASAGTSSACSNFSVIHRDNVFFGSNDDQAPDHVSAGEAYIKLYPPNAAGFGYAEFGYWIPQGRIWSRNGAVNESGLAYGTMSVPILPLNPHPERRIQGFDHFFSQLMRKVVTVEEAVQLAKQTDFSDLGDTMAFQIQLADATGDAVVISPGLDGELVFTRQPVDRAYMMSTNFNSGVPEHIKAGGINAYERYDTAVRMLNQIVAAEDVSEVSARQVLDAVHLESWLSFATSSRVFDLRRGDIYLYYYSQFDNGVRLNLAEHFKKGHQQIRMRDLFPQGTAERGESLYQAVRVREIATLLLFISAVVLFIGSLTALLAVKIRGRKDPATNASSRKAQLFVCLSGISWSAAFGCLLLILLNTYPPNLIAPTFPIRAALILGSIGSLGVVTAGRAILSLRDGQSDAESRLTSSADLPG